MHPPGTVTTGPPDPPGIYWRGSRSGHTGRTKQHILKTSSKSHIKSSLIVFERKHSKR